MSAAYSLAAIPEPFTILGLRLKPFSLGHYILMDRFEVAFVKEEEPRLGDLVFAVLICSMTFEDFIKLMETEDLEKFVTAWGEKLGKFDFTEKVSLFIDYLKTGCKGPDYVVEKETPGAASGAHWTHAVLVGLTSSLGYSQTEALNTPLPKALLDYYKYAENQGAIRLLSEEEIKLRDSIMEGVAT